VKWPGSDDELDEEALIEQRRIERQRRLAQLAGAEGNGARNGADSASM
jgi:hypothetical protein